MDTEISFWNLDHYRIEKFIHLFVYYLRLFAGLVVGSGVIAISHCSSTSLICNPILPTVSSNFHISRAYQTFVVVASTTGNVGSLVQSVVCLSDRSASILPHRQLAVSQLACFNITRTSTLFWIVNINEKIGNSEHFYCTRFPQNTKDFWNMSILNISTR